MNNSFLPIDVQVSPSFQKNTTVKHPGIFLNMVQGPLFLFSFYFYFLKNYNTFQTRCRLQNPILFYSGKNNDTYGSAKKNICKGLVAVTEIHFNENWDSGKSYEAAK